MKHIIILFTAVVFSFSAQAQAGFIGKRNFVSFDVFSLAYQQEIALQYRFSIASNMALQAGFSMLSDEDIYSGKSFEIGIVGSSTLTNLPQPLGFYYGYAYQLYTGTQMIETKELDWSGIWHIEEKEFKDRTHILKFLYGKNTYLAENFTLDLNLQLGFTLPSVKDEMGMEPNYNASYNLYPKHLGLLIWGSDPEAGLGFYVMPNIRIGYMF